MISPINSKHKKPHKSVDDKSKHKQLLTKSTKTISEINHQKRHIRRLEYGRV